MAEQVGSTRQPQISTDQDQISRENQQARDPGFRSDEQIETRQPAENRQQGDEGIETRERQTPKVVTSKFQDKRARMFDSARDLRDAQAVADPEFADQIAQARRDAIPKEVDHPERKEPTQDQPNQQQPGAKRKLKVNGKDIEVSDEELLAHAQRAMASDDILEGAKRDRDLATELLRTAQTAFKPAGTPAADERQPAKDADAEPTRGTKPAGADLAKIVEQIQFGNTDEAQAALEKFGEDIAERTATKVRSELDTALPSQVRGINEGEQRSTRTRAALQTVNEANPELNNDEVLQGAFAAATAGQMRKNILAAGINEDKLKGWMAETRLPPAEATALAYTQLMDRGYELPSHADVVTAAHKSLVDRGMLKVQQRQEQRQEQRSDNNNRFDPAARLERKREIATQPRRAGVSPSSESQQESGDRGIAVVRQMRANRGRRA